MARDVLSSVEQSQALRTAVIHQLNSPPEHFASQLSGKIGSIYV
jgi:hypothetical protein